MKILLKQKIQFLLLLFVFSCQPTVAQDEADSSPDDPNAPLNPAAPINDYLPLLVVGALVGGIYFIQKKEIKKV